MVFLASDAVNALFNRLRLRSELYSWMDEAPNMNCKSLAVIK